MSKRILDIQQWNRKEHYEFFSQFEEPYFGLNFSIDCTIAYQKAKSRQISFFVYYLYQSLKACNDVDNFKYRIEDGQVFCYEQIHASATIGRPDTTFGFSFVPFSDSLEEFARHAAEEAEAIHNSTGLRLNDRTGRADAIHFSSIPWINFTGLTHARNYKYPDSVPKISFGKMHKKGDKLLMNSSVHVHHGLMDGYHVGLYVDAFQNYMNA